MKPSVLLAPLALSLSATFPGVYGWGSLGHITSAYVASRFVSNSTEAYFRDLLNDPSDRYLAAVATWADSFRYSRWGRFTKTFHFIDAHDSPPDACGVDFDRDCKESGCIVTAVANYTERSVDRSLSPHERAMAAKFVIHLVADAHQPLHAEDVARGGNGIHVRWDGQEYNLHHVWDSEIAERLVGGSRRERRRRPFERASAWADHLAAEIADGKFSVQSKGWLDDLDFADPAGTAMQWARESNAYVCTHVFPEGVRAIEDQELAGKYYKNAAPVIELQVARAGFRMAAWLDMIVEALSQPTDEL